MKFTVLIIILLLSFSVHSGFARSVLHAEGPEKGEVSITRLDIIRYAKKFIGTPYRAAGSNPKKGFDCSGFVNYVFKNFKINLPRSSGAFDKLGGALKPEEFKIGDVLVFYSFGNKNRIGHVGIICEADGLNSRFIHSSSGRSKGIIY